MDKTESVADLIERAENLLAKLSDVKSPETQALRAKVQSGIDDAKRGLGKQFDLNAERVQKITGAVVQYVQQNPWVAVAAGSAIAIALIYVAFTGRDRQADA